MENQEDLRELLKKWGFDDALISKFEEEEVTTETLEKFLPKAGPRARNTLTGQRILCHLRNSGNFAQQNILSEVDKDAPSNETSMDYDEANRCFNIISGPTNTQATELSPNSNQTETCGTSKSVRVMEPRGGSPQPPTDVLEQLLNKSPEGKIVLAYWKTEKKFNANFRKKVGDEIIRDLLRENVESGFPDSKVEYWSKLIVQKFPGEILSVWAGSSKNRSSCAGRGVLLCRYYNFRRKLVKTGVIRKSAFAKDSEDDEQLDAESDTELEDCLNWLQNNTRAVAPVIEKWRRTSLIRVQRLRASQNPIDDYLDSYPVLKLSDAFTLIEADFEEHYPTPCMKLFSEWVVLSTFILGRVKLAEKESVEDSFTPDGKKAKTIRLLHSLFPVKNISCKGRKSWRPSRIEARDAILQYAKTTGEIQTVLTEKRKRYRDLGMAFPPQVVLVSQDEDTIDSSHVVIENVVYNVDRPLRAYDVAFKAAHMLDVHYPKEICREMVFLQVAVYGFMTQADKKIIDKNTVALIEEYKAYKSSK